jgi:hypothetical protein
MIVGIQKGSSTSCNILVANAALSCQIFAEGRHGVPGFRAHMSAATLK